MLEILFFGKKLQIFQRSKDFYVLSVISTLNMNMDIKSSSSK